jgi:hypothetical protein
MIIIAYFSGIKMNQILFQLHVKHAFVLNQLEPKLKFIENGGFVDP